MAERAEPANPPQTRRAPRFAAGRARALGLTTRGTTNPNRLRRIDRWITGTHWVREVLRGAEHPVVVDLGFGASPVTTLEFADRLRAIRPDVRLYGLEIDPERVAAARPSAEPPLIEFRHGGFELAGLGHGRPRPVLVRAFNVLRQYPEEQARAAWSTVLDRLAPGGLLVEGTCDELGRRCCWVTLDGSGPRTFTLSCGTAHLSRPSDLADRLPKALIHRNVPGERIHRLLTELDACWSVAAPHAPFGQRVRWAESIRLLAHRGWPVLDRWPRWRLGELTVPWTVVAPA